LKTKWRGHKEAQKAQEKQKPLPAEHAEGRRKGRTKEEPEIEMKAGKECLIWDFAGA
jgi:hypothetical protein